MSLFRCTAASVGRVMILSLLASSSSAAAQPVATLDTVLSAPGEPVPTSLGGSVAVSADGAWALVSAGAKTAVFQRAGATWKATALLPAQGEVAITDDASRAAVGGRVFVRSGSTWTLEATLSAVSGVALTPDGTRALVSDPNGASAPAVHVRSGTSWAPEGTLTVPGLVATDRFGVVALSADGTRALVGAPGYDSTKGRAWVFVRGAGGWSLEDELSGTGLEEQEFGTSVALSADGSRALVGEPLSLFSAKNTPCYVHVFNRSGSDWTFETKIEGPGGSDPRFGNKVALSRDGARAVIGAPNYHSTPIYQTGSVHFYVRAGAGTWTSEKAFSERGHDWLGSDVAFTADATRAVVGNLGDDSISGPDTGSARSYVRTLSGWTEEGDLVADGPQTGDLFGAAVAIADDGAQVVVGAPAAATALHPDGGRAFSYLRSGTTWGFEQHFPASGRPAFDSSGSWDQVPVVSRTPASFGATVAITASGDRVLVGEPANRGGDGTLIDGAVRVFVRSPSGWLEEALLSVSQSGDRFIGAGAAIALTADGTRALVGGSDGFNNFGALSIWARGANGWAEEKRLTGELYRDSFGAVVAIADDGTRAFASVGPTTASGSTPATAPHVRVLLRSGTSWSDETTLSASASVTAIAVGHQAALAAIGHVDGSIRLFARTGTTWSDAGLLRQATGSIEQAAVSLAISANGKRVLAGLPNDDTAAGTDAGSARLYEHIGSSWNESTLLAPEAAAGDRFGSAVAITRDGRRAVVGAQASDVAVPGGGSIVVFTLSSDCSVNSECASGYCVDGVCCDGPCGGGVLDCQACSLAAGGTEDGTCTPLGASAAELVSCRAAAGVCDVAEVCSELSTACPADAFAAVGFVCRASVDASCDSAEQCDGTSAQCPADVHTCGAPPVDAGTDGGTDAGPDAGVDAGTDPVTDDAGPEAGLDAGVGPETDDAGPDAGIQADASPEPEAPSADAAPETPDEPESESNASCSAGTGRRTPAGALLLALATLTLTRRRRQRRRDAVDGQP